jgi:hypothetical protein
MPSSKSKPNSATKTVAKRDGQGRFKPGCTPGPGRPPAIEERAKALRATAYLRAVRQGIPPAEVVAIAQKLVKLAKAGSINAARTLFEHLLPRPTEREAVEQNFILGFEEPEEFRVAGLAPAQVDARFLRQMADMIDEEVARDERTRRSATSDHFRAEYEKWRKTQND